MVQSFRVLLHHRAILGMEPDQSGQGREPNTAPDVVLLLAVPGDLEVMHVLLAVEEGQDQGVLLAGPLSDEVCTRGIDLFQALAG